MMAKESSAHSALRARIAGVRETSLPQVRQGFSIIRSMPTAQRDEAVAGLVSSISRGSNVSIDSFSKKLSMTHDEAGSVFLAVAAVAGALIDLTATSDEFIQEATHFFDAADVDAAKYVADFVVAQRDELQSGTKLHKLGVSVLPAFAGIDSAVDIRLSFEGDEIAHTVPVAVLYIYTDTSKAQIWMQATEEHLDEIIGELSKVKARLALARAQKVGA